jgi:hypothetical protein
MKSSRRGKSTLAIKVLNQSPHGLWILVKAREYFLDFKNFPWFKGVRLSQLSKVEFIRDHHLYWPSLDVDLDLDCLESPTRYPLVARVRV